MTEEKHHYSAFAEALRDVIDDGTCVGCGACVALDSSGQSVMENTPLGPVPRIAADAVFPNYLPSVCPSVGIAYPSLYEAHYGHIPDNWLTGHVEIARTGYAADPEIRRIGSSGGVLTQTLVYLLESGLVESVILVRQGAQTPEKAQAVIANTREEIIACAQSVYIPVSVLDILCRLEPSKKYAITCLPEQSAALRVMQQNGFAPALQIKYVLGPYTGTSLYPSAINYFLRSKGVKKEDSIISLNWRAGEWPGCLEIKTTSGRVIKTPKIYYNFLIPFFVTQTSLQSMDFVNEFADLAVGDAWSPVFEAQKGGHSVVVARTPEMERIISEMSERGLLKLREVDPLKVLDMHGHMLDFKKRGGWLRNQWRRRAGRTAPDYGYRPAHIPPSRIVVEIVITTLFAIGKTRFARWMILCIPEFIIGPIFNYFRLAWKKVSRPSKRKGLADFEVIIQS